jgi:hypothetical protein
LVAHAAGVLANTTMSVVSTRSRSWCRRAGSTPAQLAGIASSLGLPSLAEEIARRGTTHSLSLRADSLSFRAIVRHSVAQCLDLAPGRFDLIVQLHESRELLSIPPPEPSGADQKTVEQIQVPMNKRRAAAQGTAIWTGGQLAASSFCIGLASSACDGAAAAFSCCACCWAFCWVCSWA